MFRHPVDSPTFLKETVLGLIDDLALPWQTYPCLEWPRNRYKDGYGCIYKYLPSGQKTTRRVHREAWELIHGPIPDGILICHHCDNPACYRPIHLFKGDNSANMIDCHKKGRRPSLPQNFIKHGEEHGQSKLTEQQVAQIRQRYQRRIVTQSSLARDFGVSQTLIGHIVRRTIWKHF